jgi:hypothetical protein
VAVVPAVVADVSAAADGPVARGRPGR